MVDDVKATLLALAERVEKAEGPDRELDRLIHFHAVHPWLATRCVKWKDAAFEDEGEFLWWDAEHLASGKEGYPDRYELVTASLDAAFTLVGEGSWHIDRYRRGSDVEFIIYAHVEWRKAFAATPPLALTAAALRARAGGPDAV